MSHPDLESQLLPLVIERQQHAEVRDTADRRVRELTDTISALMTAAETPKLRVGDWNVTVSEGSRPTIVKERLVELGVDPLLIEQATKVSTYPLVNVRKAGAAS